jgi:hypothetical protein
MLQQVNQTEARDLEWSCQAVSPMDEPCDSSATFHCGICGRSFCAVHAEDETCHTCVLEPGDEGAPASAPASLQTFQGRRTKTTFSSITTSLRFSKKPAGKTYPSSESHLTE